MCRHFWLEPAEQELSRAHDVDRAWRTDRRRRCRSVIKRATAWMIWASLNATVSGTKAVMRIRYPCEHKRGFDYCSTRPVRGDRSCGSIGLQLAAPVMAAWPGSGPRVRAHPCFLLRCGHISARDRSTVEYELALRPGHSLQVRMPSTRYLRRGTERGLLVLTAGLVSYVLGVIPPTRWTRLNV